MELARKGQFEATGHISLTEERARSAMAKVLCSRRLLCMISRQYDRKTAWLQSGMNAKYLLIMAV